MILSRYRGQEIRRGFTRPGEDIRRTMPDDSDRGPDQLLKATVLSLEAEYRAFRQASERYHDRAEQDFQLALSLVTADRGAPAEPNTADESRPASDPPRVHLTVRETQILTLIAAGHSTKEAGYLLGIRFKTAAGHRSQLMKKLGIHDTASLVRFAIRTGLVKA